MFLSLRAAALKEFVTAGEPLLFKRNLLVAVRCLRDDQPTIGLLQTLVDRFAFTLYRFRHLSALLGIDVEYLSVPFYRFPGQVFADAVFPFTVARSSGAMNTSILR